MTIAPTIETTEIIKHISSVNKEVTIYLSAYLSLHCRILSIFFVLLPELTNKSTSQIHAK